MEDTGVCLKAKGMATGNREEVDYVLNRTDNSGPGKRQSKIRRRWNPGGGWRLDKYNWVVTLASRTWESKKSWREVKVAGSETSENSGKVGQST